jgi:GTPase SAR1 family protein
MEHNNTKFDNEDSKAKKVMMLGDAGSGMTCMLLAYKDNKTPDFDSYYSRQWDGQPFPWAPPGYAPVTVDWLEEDPPCRRAAQILRVPWYSASQVVVIFFSIAKPESLENVRTIYAPEYKKYTGGSIPAVLIGCKVDLRKDPEVIKKLAETNQSPVSRRQGEAVAKEIGAFKYLECSAKTMEGIKEAVEYCLELARESIIFEDEAERRASAKAGNSCIVL